jgi:hypothetical protein
MDVIFDAADLKCGHSMGARDATNIRLDAILNICGNPRFSVFGAEY